MFVHPLKSAQFVAKTAKHVKCDESAAKKTAELLRSVLQKDGCLVKRGGGSSELDPQGLTDVEELHRVFLINTLNFCFWADPGQPTYGVKLRGKLWTGYRGLCAAITRAHEEGVPVCQPSFYDVVTPEMLSHILRSDTDAQIPLMEDRWKNVKEASDVLKEKFSGSLEAMVQSANGDAWSLVEVVAGSFPSYRDVASYQGQPVSFLKRAQIVVSDLYHVLGGKGIGALSGIEKLTMFADYRVPQSLQYFGLLTYSDELLDKLKKGIPLSAGSENEVEIRACSIWAVELIRCELSALMSKFPEVEANAYIATQIDYFLWHYAKGHAEEMEHLPIHHTRTVFY